MIQKMFYVYILYSDSHQKKYVGLTQDVHKRLKEHNSGSTVSTKPYVPWKLVYSEKFQSRIEARKREKHFKSAAGRRYIKTYIFKRTIS